MWTLGREQQYFLNDNRRKAPPPSTAQHGNLDTRVYLPDVRGGGVASYVQAGFASHDQLSALLTPPSALARRRVSPSSRDSLARASLMASAWARRRVSLSSGDSLARARSESAVLDRKSQVLRVPVRVAGRRVRVPPAVSARSILAQPHPKIFLISIPCNWY